ncbi:hypothetical protein [Pectinatus brassicae]|uniref:Fe-S cluster assembly iron-binding protein IscA n=1 Tax=Pectinatus brassicae TaxID=862415 RepID=A0A840URT9_9FIRM|nr:hypothetical protein [Pectinatus brassicae]MBB5335703.1 Fe-S cluster assembly iron-binding protein IscA [Pectinatus brassicae]
MIITDSAKIMLNEAIKNSQNDCVHVMLQQSCCGEGIFMQLEKLPDNEKVVMVNSVPVFIDKKAVERIAEITIDTKNGRLIMIDPQASGGCC